MGRPGTRPEAARPGPFRRPSIPGRWSRLRPQVCGICGSDLEVRDNLQAAASKGRISAEASTPNRPQPPPKTDRSAPSTVLCRLRGGLGKEEGRLKILSTEMPGSCPSPLSASGRVLVATNGCFGDVEPERSGSERRAASEKLDGQVWVGSRLMRERVVRILLPTSSESLLTEGCFEVHASCSARHQAMTRLLARFVFIHTIRHTNKAALGAGRSSGYKRISTGQGPI